MSAAFEKLARYAVIRDTYTVEGVLGEGAFGVVYKVRHKYLGIQALKVFHPEKVPRHIADNFLNEAVLLAGITHPNVVRVFEANHFDFNGNTVAYVAMEFLPGGTLDAFLKEKGRLEPNLAVFLQMMICRGLSQAHNLKPPVIHRDVKPHNILLDSTGPDFNVKVSDFGQAKRADPQTLLTDAAGTLTYMPPEGFWNYQSPASDVYAAGMIFYAMLTGKPPFLFPGGKSKDYKELEREIRKSRLNPPEKPSIFNPGIEPELDSIVLKSLANDTENRYKDAGGFLRELEAFASMESPAFHRRMEKILALGRQYRDLSEAIAAMQGVSRGLPDSDKQVFEDRYGIILDSWKKGVIL